MIVTQPFPGHLKAEERKKDPKQHGEQSRRREKVDRDPGLRLWLRLRTEMGVDVLLMPYVQRGTKRTGDR